MGKKAKKASITVDAVIPKETVFFDQEKSKSHEINKKKKKKHKLLNDQDKKNDKSEIDVSEICDASDVPKIKKKKKNKKLSIEDENKQEFTTETEEKTLRKKISDRISHDNENIEKTIGDNVEKEVTLKVKKKKTKSHKKKKPKSDVLNEEDAQVKEEDIDRFCEELDAEDNKQYEDWVHLLEASLPPCGTK